MERITVKEILRENKALENIRVGGWVRNLRASNVFGFIDLNDGSCFDTLQIVFEEKVLSNYAEIAAQNIGAALVVEGNIVLTPGAKQPLELHAVKIEVEGASTPTSPLQKKKHSLEFLRSISYLRPRTNTFNAVFRVRSVAAYAIHKFFNEQNFVYYRFRL